MVVYPNVVVIVMEASMSPLAFWFVTCLSTEVSVSVSKDLARLLPLRYKSHYCTKNISIHVLRLLCRRPLTLAAVLGAAASFPPWNVN